MEGISMEMLVAGGLTLVPLLSIVLGAALGASERKGGVERGALLASKIRRANRSSAGWSAGFSILVGIGWYNLLPYLFAIWSGGMEVSWEDVRNVKLDTLVSLPRPSAITPTAYSYSWGYGPFTATSSVVMLAGNANGGEKGAIPTTAAPFLVPVRVNWLHLWEPGVCFAMENEVCPFLPGCALTEINVGPMVVWSSCWTTARVWESHEQFEGFWNTARDMSGIPMLPLAKKSEERWVGWVTRTPREELSDMEKLGATKVGVEVGGLYWLPSVATALFLFCLTSLFTWAGLRAGVGVVDVRGSTQWKELVDFATEVMKEGEAEGGLKELIDEDGNFEDTLCDVLEEELAAASAAASTSTSTSDTQPQFPSLALTLTPSFIITSSPLHFIPRELCVIRDLLPGITLSSFHSNYGVQETHHLSAALLPPTTESTTPPPALSLPPSIPYSNTAPAKSIVLAQAAFSSSACFCGSCCVSRPTKHIEELETLRKILRDDIVDDDDEGEEGGDEE